MPKYRVVTPKGASFTVAGGGYDYEKEALDQIGPGGLDEPGHVLGEVLGGLGHEVAEVAQDLVPHAVGGGHAALVDHALERRVEVLAVALE